MILEYFLIKTTMKIKCIKCFGKFVLTFLFRGVKTGETAPTPGQPKSRGPWHTRHEFAHIDDIFLVAFPATFAVFNILYWFILFQQLDEDIGCESLMQ